MEKHPRLWFQNWKNIALLYALMGAVIALAGFIRYQLLDRFVVYIPQYWPVNIYYPAQITWTQILVTIGIFAAALVTLKANQPRLLRSASLIAGFGFILIILTNSIHGLRTGITYPISGAPGGNGMQYYHDLPRITQGLLEFIHDYVSLQPSLLGHAQTHPFGPVALIYILHQVFPHTWFVSLSIAVVSAALSVIFLYHILKHFVSESITRTATLMYLVIPAVQIYFLTSTDALISALILGGIYAMVARPTLWRFALGATCLWLASSLSFLATFALPVMIGFVLIKRQQRLFVAGMLTVVMLGWAVFFSLTGYNYLQSFFVAHAIEAANTGKTLSAYIATRLDCLGETFIFLGPVLGALLVQGLMIKRRSSAALLAWLGIGTYGLLLAVNVFRNGETARAALFLYPFLFFAITLKLAEMKPTQQQTLILFGAVFAQTVVMQLIGTYFW
jgi:hypothetical protein